MILSITLPIAVIETILLYQLLARRGRFRGSVAERQKLLNSALMRFSFSAQLMAELLTGSKVTGCVFSFILGIMAGYLAIEDANLNDMSDILMNVFMGISMGVFLIGHLPMSLTILLIAPVLLSSCLTLLHTLPLWRQT